MTVRRARAASSVRGWLAERALEHERPVAAVRRAPARSCAGAGSSGPAIDRLMRLVAWARERAHERTFERLAAQLTEPGPSRRSTGCWPDRRAARIAACLAALPADHGQRRRAAPRARQARVPDRASSAPTGSTCQGCRRTGGRGWRRPAASRPTRRSPGWRRERRYPVLMCFCAEALERATDDALEVFDRALGAADRAAQRKRDELEPPHRRDTQTTVRRFVDLTQRACSRRTTPAPTCSRLIDRRIGLERLRAGPRPCRADRPPAPTRAPRPADRRQRRPRAASCSASVHRARSSSSATGVDEDELLAALRLIARARRQRIGGGCPGFSPSAFIDAQWRDARRRRRRAAGSTAAPTSCAPPTSCARRCAPGGCGCRAAAGTPTPPATCCQTSSGSRPATRSRRRSTSPLDGRRAPATQLAGEQAELAQTARRGRATPRPSARLNDGELVVDRRPPTRTRRGAAAASSSSRAAARDRPARAADRGRRLDRLHRAPDAAEREPPAARASCRACSTPRSSRRRPTSG